MSEGKESDKGVQTGGRRRRRLTLAPRPWASERRREQEEKVSSTLFADSGRSGGGTTTTGDEVGTEYGEGWASSSVGSSSDIRSEFKRVANGSRFWALADDVCSDEEPFTDDVLHSVGETSSNLSRVLCSGLGASMADETQLCARVETLDVSKLECVFSSRKAQSRHPKSMQRRSKACRPWKGPLPPARAVQGRSLGDLWVEDRRFGKSGARSKLSEFVEGECSSPPLLVEPPEVEKKEAQQRDPVSKFKFEVPLSAFMGRVHRLLWVGIEPGGPFGSQMG
jgi:hypothetical protein